MGMTAAFASITPEELNSLQRDPAKLSQLFFDRVNQGDVEKGLDIDKSWAAIHFLLTGTQWEGTPPESLPVLGGSDLGDEREYGPVRYLEPSLVSQASAVLEGLPTPELKKRFIPARLEEADIYPSGIWLDEGEEGFEYIAHWYEQLSAFYRAAAKNGNAVLLAIS